MCIIPEKIWLNYNLRNSSSDKKNKYQYAVNDITAPMKIASSVVRRKVVLGLLYIG